MGMFSLPCETVLGGEGTAVPSTFPVYLLFTMKTSAPLNSCDRDAIVPSHAFKYVGHPWRHRQAWRIKIPSSGERTDERVEPRSS